MQLRWWFVIATWFQTVPNLPMMILTQSFTTKIITLLLYGFANYCQTCITHSTKKLAPHLSKITWKILVFTVTTIPLTYTLMLWTLWYFGQWRLWIYEVILSPVYRTCRFVISMGFWLMLSTTMLSILSLLKWLFTSRESLRTSYISLPIWFLTPILRLTASVTLTQRLVRTVYADDLLSLVNESNFKGK